jgi:transposase
VGVFCGIDWAESHHDIAVVDAEGRLLARQRIRDDAAGYQQLLQLLAEAGDTATDPIPVAIQTSRGLLVACLRTTGRRVYAINPLAVSRYRDRHGVAGTSPTTPTRSCWQASCAPTPPPTGPCQPTPSSPRRSRCWPAPSRTRSGTASSWP